MLKINSFRYYYFNNKRAIKHFNIIKYVSLSVCLPAVFLVNTSLSSAAAVPASTSKRLPCLWLLLKKHCRCQRYLPSPHRHPAGNGDSLCRPSCPSGGLARRLAGWLTTSALVPKQETAYFFGFYFVFLYAVYFLFLSISILLFVVSFLSLFLCLAFNVAALPRRLTARLLGCLLSALPAVLRNFYSTSISSWLCKRMKRASASPRVYVWVCVCCLSVLYGTPRSFICFFLRGISFARLLRCFALLLFTVVVFFITFYVPLHLFCAEFVDCSCQWRVCALNP